MIMELFAIFIIGPLLGIITGKIAENKGHSFWGWWFFGWMLFIIALPWSLLLSKDEEAISRRDGNTKKCPYCAEWIKVQATVCKFCGKDLVEKEGK
jgi:apolipoprotein N-acyltransferase